MTWLTVIVYYYMTERKSYKLQFSIIMRLDLIKIVVGLCAKRQLFLVLSWGEKITTL